MEDNPQLDNLNLNPDQLNHLLGAFEDVPNIPPIQGNQNIPAIPDEHDEDAEYERKFVRPFPEPEPYSQVKNQNQHVIGVNQLKPNVVYYKVMDNDTKYDRTQLKFNSNQGNAIYWFENKFGIKMIPHNNQSRFISAYQMFPDYYPNPDNDKFLFRSIYGIDPEETTIDKDSSDEDSDYSDYSDDSEMDLEGGKKRRRNKKQKKFHFTSTQKHQHGGKKTVRHVTIKNGKGHKKVSHYRGNKLIRTIKKSLKKTEMEMIRLGKFIPGLFRDCQVSRKKSTTRYRRNK
jgi:hypothetical protein